MGYIKEAFNGVPRREFLPEPYKNLAYLDEPLPIGFGQTNSQPSTVARMLDWLEARPGDKVLEVGSGSGWVAALLAHIVGREGIVYAVEKVPELVDLSLRNARRLGIMNISFHKALRHVYGLPSQAPYDRILVSASSDKLPKDLIFKQLKVGGKLVVPVRNDVLEIHKTGAKAYETFKHSGYAFVPLVR